MRGAAEQGYGKVERGSGKAERAGSPIQNAHRWPYLT